jgi:hypothetical protein
MNMRRVFSTAMIAMTLVLGLTAAPATLAKGRPMHAAFSRSSCFTFTVDATWWKRLDVHSVKVDLFASPDNWLGAVAWSSEPGFSSPFTRTYENNGGASTMYAVVSIYAVTDVFTGTPTPLASTTTAAVTASCG